MEPSGRNRWQPVSNGAAAKVAQTGEIALPWAATGCRGNAMARRGSPVRCGLRGNGRTARDQGTPAPVNEHVSVAELKSRGFLPRGEVPRARAALLQFLGVAG